MKTVQIDCILEFSFEDNLTREELIKCAEQALNATSYNEIGEMLQIDDADDWHIFDENGDEIEN